MASCNQLPLAGQRLLLPAPSPRTTADGIMQGKGPDGADGADGVQSNASGKFLRRTKVTAVACQPCQRRKSKCDGQRPICSACNTKRSESECHYDSAGDQRRTSSLKERIQAKEREVRDLKTIIRTICADPSTVDLVRERLVLNDFSHSCDIANLFRTRDVAVQDSVTTLSQAGFSAATTSLGYNGFTVFQETLYGQPSFLNEGPAPSPTATAQSDWSSEVISGEEREEPDFMYEGQYPPPGAPSWP
ncbi:hypothetical protein FKW77_007915 [Venturia effusa]|uniref:Zn(2)-C6 fungal-type domain-containing protein n=1 Tax=Venturia effusa TaxID=50376 RepID=A0A517LG63_9PEZI|nr:hypothetical protein FKW77_007915 [Venturia effusa]